VYTGEKNGVSVSMKWQQRRQRGGLSCY